jgi:hypothetical protein
MKDEVTKVECEAQPAVHVLQTLVSEKERGVRAKKTHFFKKKSSVKIESLLGKYAELTKSGKLDSFLSKQRVRKSQKLRRFMPRNESTK